MKTLTKEEIKYSKTLALVLRHKPEALGLTLDSHGWIEVSKLIKAFRDSGRSLDMIKLQNIVDLNNKKRYEFNGDKTKIRARQGHSVDVDVELEELEPPKVLYHGTARRNIQGIIEEGLKPMSRKYVHLSTDIATAVEVACRHGEPLVLEIDSDAMYQDGQKFYRARNGVWLCKFVHPDYMKYT